MRFRAPRDGRNGIYGGSGSRPATRAWTPGVDSHDERPPEEVREDLKRVSLRPKARWRRSAGPTRANRRFALAILLLGFGVATLFTPWAWLASDYNAGETAILFTIFLGGPWFVALGLTLRRTRLERSRLIACGIYAFSLWALQTWAFLGVRSSPWESGDLNHLTYVVGLVLGTLPLLTLFLFAWWRGGSSRGRVVSEKPPLSDYTEPFA